MARAAALGHALTALAVVGIGLAGGALGVLAAYLVSYCFFGGTGPLHAALVHREATAANRTTVLSLGSMVSFTVFAVVAPLAGLLSGVTSLGLATVVLGVGGLLGVAAYAPAVRAERAASTSPVTSPVTSPPTTPVRPR